MSMDVHRSQSTVPAPVSRRPWTAPHVDDLPRLIDLTLQTASGIPGSCLPGSPSSCFP